MLRFTEKDFPDRLNSGHGFSLYRGVLIQWDEDHDERILEVLDGMPARILDRLLITHENQAGIAFVWKGEVPRGYEKDKEIGLDSDVWHIGSSVALKDPEEVPMIPVPPQW